MRTYVMLLGGLTIFVAAVRADEVPPRPPAAPKEKAEKTSYLPGSFQAWMVTGKHAGRFHSPVGEYGLNPALLLFVQKLDQVDGLTELLMRIDRFALKHPDARFGCCVVVLHDGGFRQFIFQTDNPADGNGKTVAERLADASNAKDVLEKKLTELSQKGKLERVVFALVPADQVKKFSLPADAAVSGLLYNKHVVLGTYALKDKPADADLAKIAGDAEKVILSVEEASRPQRKTRK